MVEISKLEVKKELCNRSFWYYCKLSDSSFFKESRPHLKELAETLQLFYEEKLLNEDGEPYSILGISVPPRMGKSYILTKFCQWMLGKNKDEKLATVSYSEGMAGEFSRFVRDGIQEGKVSPEDYVYSDIFPDTKIKRGDASAYKWSLEGQFFNYIGTGMNGQLTGKGFTIGIIDDPIKNAIEALNDRVLDEHYNFYKNTFRSRIETGRVIINHTRWASSDLLGKLLIDQKKKIYHLVMQMEDSEGNLLCKELCSLKNWEDLKETIDPHILSANYQQVPIDIKGRLYNDFKTYTPNELPTSEPSKSYTDTADTGLDFLCSIAYRYCKKTEFVYVEDVIYTQKPMEITEPLIAQQFKEFDVKLATIESNNGGRGFARNVETRLKSKEMNHKGTMIEWFHQSKNKEARIFSQSFWVTKHILMPEGWDKKWPKLFVDLMKYSKDGKNLHDDAPDVLTGIAENITEPKRKVGSIW